MSEVSTVTSVELELNEAFSGCRLPGGERGTVATVCPVLRLMMDVHGQLTAQDRRAVLKWQRRPRAQTLLHHSVASPNTAAPGTAALLRQSARVNWSLRALHIWQKPSVMKVKINATLGAELA